MATGRIGVTPVLRTRWSKLPTTGTTVLSGLDDNSVALVYDAGYEAVYRNGVLLSRGNDYTATDGTTVTLIDATLATDIIEIFANDLVPLTDAISKGQYNAKGALLSATAASTPAVLAVGTNGQVLTADSTAGTGLAWATPGGSLTLAQIASGTTTSGTSLSLTSLTAYDTLKLRVSGLTTSANNGLNVTINSSASSVYDYLLWQPFQNSSSSFDGSTFQIDERETTNTMFNLIVSGYEKLSTNTTNFFEIDFYNCKATGFTTFEYQGIYASSAGSTYRAYPMGRGIFKTAAAVSSIQFKTSSAFTAGNYVLWGG
jgi:hypothetical protein